MSGASLGYERRPFLYFLRVGFFLPWGFPLGPCLGISEPPLGYRKRYMILRPRRPKTMDSIDFLNPEQVKEFLVGAPRLTGLPIQSMAYPLEQFVRAHAEGEIACEENPHNTRWTAPRPGCKCDSCNSVNVARLIVESMEECGGPQ